MLILKRQNIWCFNYQPVSSHYPQGIIISISMPTAGYVVFHKRGTVWITLIGITFMFEISLKSL